MMGPVVSPKASRTNSTTTSRCREAAKGCGSHGTVQWASEAVEKAVHPGMLTKWPSVWSANSYSCRSGGKWYAERHAPMLPSLGFGGRGRFARASVGCVNQCSTYAKLQEKHKPQHSCFAPREEAIEGQGVQRGGGWGACGSYPTPCAPVQVLQYCTLGSSDPGIAQSPPGQYRPSRWWLPRVEHWCSLCRGQCWRH